jgi:hypothetical protein
LISDPIIGSFPLETFTGLLGKHLETFRELESLQSAALQGMKNQGIDGLAAMLAKQQEILAAIGREKGGLRPFLDQWEGLPAAERARLRAGRPGEILDALEAVARAIQARHQEMFGADDAAMGSAPAAGASASGPAASGGSSQEAPAQEPDLSQRINIYRGLQ